MSKHLGIGVVALCLALAGCGGSDGGGEPTVTQSVHDMLQEELDDALALVMETQTARDTARTQLAAAQADVTRLTGELATANTSLAGLTDELATAKSSVTSLTTDLSTAQAEVARLTTQIGSATEATSLQGMLTAANAEVTRLTSALVTANTRITTLTGQLTVAQSETASLRRQLADARTDVTEAEQRATQAETDAQTQIAQAEEQATVAVRAPLLITDLSGLETNDDVLQMGVTYPPGGRRTFTRPLNLPAKGSAPSVPGSWSSASYSGPRGAVGTDTVYIYSNIQAPSKRRFWQEYGADESVDATDTDARTTGSRSTPQLVAGGDTPDDDADDMYRVTYSGRFDGAGGTFSCTATTNADTACVLTNAATVAEGLTVADGTWTFTPSSVNNPVGSDLQDRTYLYFGIWAFEPTDPADDEEDNAHNFRWAAGGDADNLTTFDSLTGTASFTGGAIGRYALAKVGGRAARVGTFTATATFNATFGDTTDTISGRITDFREGGSDLGSDWNLFLGGSPSTAATLTVTGTSGSPTTHGAINGDAATGTWGAIFQGSNNMELSDRTKYPLTTYPETELTGVAGWFQAAAGSNAAVAGAFGAACTANCAK